MKAFFSLFVCFAMTHASAQVLPSQIGTGTVLSFQTSKGLTKRTVLKRTDVSYTYKNGNNQTIESFLGVVDINLDANQGIEEAERRKISSFQEFELGRKLSFNHFGNSGYGSWLRTVNLEVASKESISIAGHRFDTFVLVGTVLAPRAYDLQFQCWYSPQLSICIKNMTTTSSIRNPSMNGDDTIQLVDITP